VKKILAFVPSMMFSLPLYAFNHYNVTIHNYSSVDHTFQQARSVCMSNSGISTPFEIKAGQNISFEMEEQNSLSCLRMTKSVVWQHVGASQDITFFYDPSWLPWLKTSDDKKVFEFSGEIVEIDDSNINLIINLRDKK
jgi:hypothetical protein